MSTPHSPYLVCATPRSDSALLCELLGETGVAGRPQAFLTVSREGVPDSAEGFDHRLRDAFATGSTPNGVWGATLMWTDLLELLRRLREREQTAKLHSREALETLLPGVQYVHLRSQEQPDLQDHAWVRWFRNAGIEPVVVVREELTDDPGGVVRRVLRDLHVDLHGATAVPA